MIGDFNALLRRMTELATGLRELSVTAPAPLAAVEEDCEWPDLASLNVPGVERQPPSRSIGNPISVAAGIIDRHAAQLKPVATHRNDLFWVCYCGLMFELHFEHSEHVADLIVNST